MSTIMESAPNYISNWDECAQHFVKAWPKEACGYVTQDNVFVPCANVAEDPLQDFLIPVETFVNVDPKCIIHSHCIDNTKPMNQQPLPQFFEVEITEENAKDIKYRDEDHDPRSPTASDLQGQIDAGCEWAICVVAKNDCSRPFYWGDYTHRPDLMQRQFIFNMNDCLSFMFDWYYKKWGIELVNVARESNFYKGKDDIFLANYEKLGFVDVSNLPPEEGDVLLWRYLSKIVSHCGIYVGDGQIVHHLAGALPSVLPPHKVKEWNKYLVKRVRYHSNVKPSQSSLSPRITG